MTITNFPYGISSFGVPVMGSFPTQGKFLYVKPYTGSNGNDGLTPDTAVKTLAYALSLATANQNDVVVLYAESNTSAYTTDYQSATLDWNKDGVHLVGVNAGPRFSHRSRVALISTYVTASNLFTLSADGCMISNIQFYAGVASANPTGCVNVTGTRNSFTNCHIAGIGDDLMDIANAYSLRLAAAENDFKGCVIGIDTIDRGSTANSEIYIAAGGLRNTFKDCLITSRIQHATNSPQVRIAGGAMGNAGLIALFDDCVFSNGSTNYGYAQTYAIVFTAATTAGYVVVRNCTPVNVTNWGVAGNQLYVHNSVSNTGYNQGLSYAS